MYFRPETLALIPAHLDNGKQAVIVGDLNARLGPQVHSIAEAFQDFSQNVVDETVNANGRSVVRTCISNNLVPVNNLKTFVV